MKNLKLTQLEEQVLDSLISQLYAEAGFSDVDANDISRDIKVDIKSVRGSLGSLVRKGIIGIDGNSSGYQIIYLNQSYWYLHPEWSKEIAQ
jgi:DNA-binding MarR family transcriptional regulator